MDNYAEYKKERRKKKASDHGIFQSIVATVLVRGSNPE
jgi:hypothetical protein